MDFLFNGISTLFISSAALTLIHFVWQGALIAIVLRLLLAVVPKNSFVTRYRLAVLALISSILLPAFTLYYLTATPDVVQSTMEYSSRAIQFIEEPTVLSSTVNAGEQQSLNTPISSYVEQNQADILLKVLLFWVFGCLVMATKFVIDLNKTYNLAKNGIAPVSSEICEITERMTRRFSMTRPIRILKSSIVNVPVVVGWLRPVVLLPIAITIGLEKKQLELIIAHELAHIKRMDFAVNVIQSIVQICFFYHPSVHWINRVIRDEREYICDEMALKMAGNDDQTKLNLAKALLNTEELREGNFSLIAVAASGGKLKHRISHILDAEYRPATSIKTIFAGLIAFMFSVAAMASTLAFDSGSNLSAPVSPLVVDQVAARSERKLNETKLNATERKSSKIDSPNTLPKTFAKRPAQRLTDQVSPKARSETNVNTNVLNAKTADTNAKPSLVKRSPVLASVEQSKATTDKTVVKKMAIASVKKEAKFNTDNSKVESENASRTAERVNLKVTKIDKQPKAKIQIETPNFVEAQKEESLAPSVAILSKMPNKQAIEKKNENKTNKPLKTASLDLSSIRDYSDPKAIYTPYPKYPRRAWSRMISQTVRVEFVINEQGKVNDIKTVGRVDKDFSREIRRKLRKWRYEPAIDNGRAISHVTSLEFVFEAPQKEKIILTTTGSRISRL